MKLRLLGAVCVVLFTFTTLSTNAALVDNGGGLIYDTVLDITWAQPDAALRSWEVANTWASGLTLGGVSGWGLPALSVAARAGGYFLRNPIDCSTATELACRDNQLGYMFYQNLSGTFGQSILTSVAPDLALFPTLQSDDYWSDNLPNPHGGAWIFGFGDGDQRDVDRQDNNYSWAVHAGNVVPVPAAVWLFGSGLLGLVGMARRKKAAYQTHYDDGPSWPFLIVLFVRVWPVSDLGRSLMPT